MTGTFVFIDSRVADYQTLVDGLAPDTQWALIDASRDGILQMMERLDGMINLDSIQIVSHGSAGTLNLGSAVLTQDKLASYSEWLARIGASLTATGDILLYGCNVGAGETGVQFIQSLAQVTGADVAASEDVTGSGGDWNLEALSGEIEADLTISDATTQSYQFQLVNTAPTVSAGSSTLTATTEDTASGTTLVSALLTNAGYADDGAISGAAITATSGPGTWQYSTDGSTWTSIQGVSAYNALLLSSTAQVRFLPGTDASGTATLTLRSWDQSNGTASTTGTPSVADTTTNGGTTAFSTGTHTANLAERSRM